MPTFKNTLEIDHQPKGIPYFGNGEVREDGDANYGFKYVKGDDQLLEKIPELSRDKNLMNLARAINGPETGLFSVGCVSAPVEDASGFRRSGYIEFSINSIAGVSDATNYFAIFFHFDRMLHKSGFSEVVSYFWELQPCTFRERGTTGFTCSVILNTHYSRTRPEADIAWSKSLGVLATFLQSVPPQGSDFIYPQ